MPIRYTWFRGAIGRISGDMGERLSVRSHLLPLARSGVQSRQMMTRSAEGEQWWEDDHDGGGPDRDDGKVGGLPEFELVEKCLVR